MSRFPELQGLSALTKLLAFLVAVGGVLGTLTLDGNDRFVIAGSGVLAAFGYWVLARFIDILLQINEIVIDLHERRPVATTAAPAALAGRSMEASAHPAAHPNAELRNALGGESGKLRAAVSPNHGPAGSAVTAGVSGVPNGERVRVTWIFRDESALQIKVLHGDASGVVVAEVAVPDGALPGAHRVLFETPRGRIEAPFTVTSV